MQKIKPLFALPLQLEFPPPYLGSGTASSARLLSQPNQRRAQHLPACCCSPVSYICLIKSSGLFINKPPEITAPIWQQLSRTFSTLSRRAWANQSCYLPKSWFRQKKKTFKEFILSWISSAIFSPSGWSRAVVLESLEWLFTEFQRCVYFIFLFRMCCHGKQGLISFPWVRFLSSSCHNLPWFISFVKKSKPLIQQVFFFSKIETFLFIWILIPTLKLLMLASILNGLCKNYFKNNNWW